MVPHSPAQPSTAQHSPNTASIHCRVCLFSIACHTCTVTERYLTVGLCAKNMQQGVRWPGGCLEEEEEVVE
ncbi:hypothetical protein E2C01_067946 [Portunus trituberculatus]|uniref:Uncharacterized protein n=1 Tax=Portunus trituberculatus TaxID=210409 RepID=A0A5B7HL69_PORTR|nr:hypothetical protein [Portunus trituberculatus]